MKLILYFYFLLVIAVNGQLFDFLNSNTKVKTEKSKGIDDLSVILKRNALESAPRFSENDKNDFISKLLSQAKSIISQKKDSTPEPMTKSLNKYLPPDFQNLPGLAKRIKNIVEETAHKNDQKFENITLNSLSAEESDAKTINAQNIKVKGSLSFPSKKFKLKIGTQTMDVSELSKALLFNVRVMKKCGKHLEKCTIHTSSIEKELINGRPKPKLEDAPIRFVEVSNDSDMDEYSSIENQLDKIDSQESGSENNSGQSNDINQDEIDEALDF